MKKKKRKIFVTNQINIGYVTPKSFPMKIKLLILTVNVLLLSSCNIKSQSNTEKTINEEEQTFQCDSKEKTSLNINTDQFERTQSFTRLRQKIQNKDTIFIHIMIPLCDNGNQGIVPVPANLGNGTDTKNNLYWGAMYGFKSYFKRSEWKLISSDKEVSDNILERVIFERKRSNSSPVMIIADAYKGDRMKQLLTDYLDAIAGKKKEEYRVLNSRFSIYSQADLIVFNGHNGLMDYDLERVATSDSVVRETAVIGCISYDYFKPHLLAGFGYPILTTSNLMAPEAYVVEGLINSWLELNSESEIRTNVGQAYHKYQKCGIRGATSLFYSGWQ